MGNIIIPGQAEKKDFVWRESPAERALRKKGHAAKETACLETGNQFTTAFSRKNNAEHAFKLFMKALYDLRMAAADQGWDDEKGVIVFGMQWRNNYEQDEDGEWHEMGSPQHLEAQARKALEK